MRKMYIRSIRSNLSRSFLTKVQWQKKKTCSSIVEHAITPAYLRVYAYIHGKRLALSSVHLSNCMKKKRANDLSFHQVKISACPRSVNR